MRRTADDHGSRTSPTPIAGRIARRLSAVRRSLGREFTALLVAGGEAILRLAGGGRIAPMTAAVELSEAMDALIRDILLNDWDPHNASKHPAAVNTYDDYIPKLRELIASRATVEQVIDFLHDREKETMCFPSLGKQRLVRVARKLLNLNS